MTCEYQIINIDNPSSPNFGNSLINSSEGLFLRRLDQNQKPKNSRIAEDDGTPIDQLDIDDLVRKANTSQCSGTYTQHVQKIDGGEATIAITKVNPSEVQSLRQDLL